MIELVYSNRTEELLAELAGRVRAQQLARVGLAPVTVVVPSASVEDYLRLGVARECGVAAGLNTPLITRFAAAELDLGERTIAGAAAFEALTLTLLLDEAFLGAADLEPVRAYLGAVQAAEAVDVRRVQLAARLGRLFEQYTFSRPELLSTWQRGPALEEGRHAEVERWQRAMWLALFGEKGLGRARGLVPLHEAIARPPLEPSSKSDRGPVHVFGFAHLGRTFHELLARVSAARDLVLYAVSPCAGFWEDFDPADPLPLQLWARPGREHVRALNALAGFDHEDRFVEPSGGSVLARLQRALLTRRADRRSETATGDESLEVFECASVRRELEAVASEIWRRLDADESLRFDQIAVLLPDAEVDAYFAHLPAVFREAHEIPLHAVDVPGGRGPVAEAVDLLLDLPLGRFTRQEVLRLVAHPAVVAGVEGVDPERWLTWCDELGIIHGGDRSDHEETYIERDVFNWDQGLRRLALGVFMAGDGSGERRPFELASESYVAHELAGTDVRDAAVLGLLVRSLVADARFLAASELTMKEWAAVLGDLVRTYVSEPSEPEGESLVGCLRALHALGEVDVGERRVSYRVVRELVRARLGRGTRRRGGEGVVVSRTGSMQPTPFRVIFACGMGERFPAPDAEDALDLRWSRRLEGDVSARERDKYAFLELLLGARDALCLSYVSRDPLTGDSLAASSVVQELLHALDQDLGVRAESVRQRHPLRRWAPAYFPELFGGASDPLSPPRLGTLRLPEARAEAQALAARRALEAAGARVDRATVVALAHADAGWAPLAEHLRVPFLGDARSPLLSEITLPIYALVKFLEFPLQGWAELRVGLDEVEDEDVLALEDEPFETDIRKETLLLRSIFLAAAKGTSLEQAYDDVLRDRQIRGLAPSGVFAQAERGEHLATLEDWKRQLEGKGVSLASIEMHRFGRAGEWSTVDRAHPAFHLEVDWVDPAGVARVIRVELGGRTLPIAADRDSLTLVRRAKEGKEGWAQAEKERMVLRAFVDHAVLSAAGIAEGRERSSIVVVSTPDGSSSERVSFEPLGRGEAVVWLRGLVRELLGGPHAYFFPCEALFVQRGPDENRTLGALLQEARDRLRDSDGALFIRSAYGPVPRPHEYPIPTEEEAREIVERRYGLLLAKSRRMP